MLLGRCLDAYFDSGLQSDVPAGVKVFLEEGFLLVVFYHRAVPEDQPATEQDQRRPFLYIRSLLPAEEPIV